MSNLSEQELIRREKLNKIRELGINPYPAELFQVTTNSSNIKSNFIEGEKVIVAGRLMSRRIQGNASYAELQDNSARIRLTNANNMQFVTPGSFQFSPVGSLQILNNK